MPSAIDAFANPWLLQKPKKGWLGQDMAKEALTVEFNGRQLEALRSMVDRLTSYDFGVGGIERGDLSDPAIDSTMQRVIDDLRRGVGLVFVRGVDVADYSTNELRLLFAGLGTHFGKLVSQSKFGDIMGDVTPQPGQEDSRRGYVLDLPLHFHTDGSEVFGLFCIVDAQTGGENVFASSLKIYEIIQDEHPEFIPILERGWRRWLTDEQPLGAPSVTPHRVPVFAWSEGLLSCIPPGRASSIRTAEALGESLGADELAAIRCFDEVAARPELHFEAALAPGEAVFINNFEILHGRRGFTHWPDRKRHLLRIWLEGNPPRPMPASYPVHRFQNRSGSQGIDPIFEPDLSRQILAAKSDPISVFMRASRPAPG